LRGAWTKCLALRVCGQFIQDSWNIHQLLIKGS
jgi:hypothetical protein